jgi:hypothetical protein
VEARLDDNSRICPACGAALREGRSSCENCHTELPKPALWRRVLDLLLKPRLRVTRTKFVLRAAPLWVIDKATGERRCAASLADLPPELREQIAHSSGQPLQKTFCINFQGADGRPQTFHSVEEMPPEVRAIYERVLPEVKAQLGSLLDDGTPR